MASARPEQHPPTVDSGLHGPSAVEGVHFDGLFRNEWDTWAKTGRLDYKGLRAFLPDAVKGLRNGKIDPQEFAECLTWQEMTVAREGIEHIPCVNRSERFSFGQVLLTVAMSWLVPDRPQSPSEHSRRQQVFGKLMKDWHQESSLAISAGVESESFSRYRPGYRHWSVTDPDDFRETLYYAVWLYSFHRALAKNEAALEELIGKRLDQIPRLRKDASKRYFDAASDHAFNAYADRSSPEFKAFYQRIKLVQLKRELVYTAALSIANGMDSLDEMCWECNTIKAEVLQCGGCKMAYYCCKEHQRQAWSRGHRNSCKLVNEVRKFMEMNLKHIEIAVKRDDILGESESLMRPCLEIDCMILKHMIGSYAAILGAWSPELQAMPSLVARSGPPSMDNYYRNLADVVNGEECFVFPDTPNLAFKDTRNDGDLSKDENVTQVSMVEGNLFVRSIIALAGAIGFRPESAEEGVKVMADSMELANGSEQALFGTARGFLNRYRSYRVEPEERRWKERKTEVLRYTRTFLHTETHRLPEKPPLFSSRK